LPGTGDFRWAPAQQRSEVTRLALQNAASIVALMLTTEVLIANIEEDEETGAVGAGHGALGGMS